MKPGVRILQQVDGAGGYSSAGVMSNLEDVECLEQRAPPEEGGGER